MKCLPLIFLAMTVVEASAFINIESIRRETGKGFVGRSGLKFSGQRGNTNKISTNVTTLNFYRFEHDEVLGLADFVYSVTSNVRDSNNGRLHLRYTFHPDTPIAPELFAQTEFDEFRDLKWRNLAGGNLRYRLLGATTQSLYAGTGIFFEKQLFNRQGGRETVRGNFYLSYVYGFNDRTSGYAVIYMQPSLRAIADTRILLHTGVGALMTERLTLDLQYNLTYDGRPPANIVPLDMMFLAGFSVKYK